MRYLTLLFVAALYLSACSQSGDNSTGNKQERLEAGQVLFTSRCATCHLPDTVLLGPALKDAESRWPDTTQLRQFIRNSGEVIARNIYANALFRQYRYSPMPAFPQLSDADIDNILLYCKEYRPIK